MARMIDADKRIAKIKKIYCDGCDNYDGVRCRACLVDDVICMIDDATTVDAVPVVRCRECKWWHEDDDVGHCDNPDGLDNYAKPDDFCSYGERKEGDGNG